MKKFVNKDLDYILPHLRLAGATKIEIPFDGQGDSGEITEIICNEIALQVKCPGRQDTYETILTNIGYAFLNDTDHDWVNNEGGYGTIKLNLMQRNLHCDMNIRVTTIKEYEYDNKI